MTSAKKLSLLALTTALLSAAALHPAQAEDAMMKKEQGQMTMQKDNGMMKKDTMMEKDTMMKGDDHMNSSHDKMMSPDAQNKDTQDKMPADKAPMTK